MATEAKASSAGEVIEPGQGPQNLAIDSLGIDDKIILSIELPSGTNP